MSRLVVSACFCNEPDESCVSCRQISPRGDLLCAGCLAKHEEPVTCPLCEKCFVKARYMSNLGIPAETQAMGIAIVKEAIEDALSGHKWFIGEDGTYSYLPPDENQGGEAA